MTDLKTQSALLVIANNPEEAENIAMLNGYPGKATPAKDTYHCAGSSLQQQTLNDLICCRS